MWRILTAYLLVVGLAHAHHDGTDHSHEEDEKALIMLEIQPTENNGTGAKDKRSPQHQTSQAVYGASPGQFVVRTTADNSATQADVPPEYLNLLQQLVAQQHQGGGEEAQAQLPVINEFLISRNPDPSAVQFSSSPSQPQRPRRPPASPQAQLQKLYFDSQFQQQIPVRPRILRPPPQPQPQPQPESQFSTVPATSQVYNIHEARLRASLAGSDPNLAVQALTQQAFPTTVSPGIDQQLTHISTPQEHLTELQSVPEPSVSHQQIISAGPQVQYVQQPVQRSASYSSPSRQAAPSTQLISVERSKLSRRPSPAPAPEQYLRETTQPLVQQTVAQVPQQQLTSDPKIYLASESGQQSPQSSQDEEFIQQLLSGGGRGFFPSSTPAPSDVAEDIIKSTTALPSAPSRSSIYVTQSSKLKNSPSSSQITIEEVGEPQENAQTPLPVVHLPTPKGQRPLTQSEFKALIDAGFNLQPVPEETQTAQSITPQYYQQPTTKRQRSYVTPTPPRNQVEYQSRQKKPQEEKEEVSYVQQVAAQPQPQQIPQQVNTRYRLQGSKPQQQEDEIVQYVRRPISPENRARPSQSRFRIVVGNSEPQEQTIQFVQLPTLPDDAQQKEQLSTFEPEIRTQQTTQLLRIQEEQETLTPQIQTTRYQPETAEPEQTYQTESVDIPQQTTTFQRQEESVAPQRQRFHPIVIPDPQSTTPVPSSTVPRRRRPRPPTHSRIVFRTQAQEEDPSNGPVAAPQQFLLSYDSVPEASSFGTRSRVRARRPVQAEES